MPVRPYLFFDGNARAAIAFYEYVFDTTADSIRTFGDLPENPDYPFDEESKKRVWNAHMKIAGDVVQISDIGPFPGFTVGNNVDLFYINPSGEAIATVYGRLMEGGSAQVELDTSGPNTYANVTDKFGVSWQLYTSDHIA
jgi:PhnB protein